MADDERPGFLGRWARRKNDALQGRPLDEPPATVAKPVPGVAAGLAGAAPGPAADACALRAAPAAEAEKPPEKLLSLEDVKALTQDSDFKPFMARDVGPDVRNAAMKKLFADPHFNVMDGLDIYIDDYSKSDPIPEAMLRQMVGAKLLKIFDHEEDPEQPENQPDHTSASQGAMDAKGGYGQHGATGQDQAAAGPTDNPDSAGPETMAQSSDSSDLASAESSPANLSSQPEPSDGPGASHYDYAHSHLRLQPDHAPPAPSAGHGAS